MLIALLSGSGGGGGRGFQSIRSASYIIPKQYKSIADCFAFGGGGGFQSIRSASYIVSKQYKSIADCFAFGGRGGGFQSIRSASYIISKQYKSIADCFAFRGGPVKKDEVLVGNFEKNVPEIPSGVRHLQTADYRLHLGLNSTLVSLNSTQVSLFKVSYW